MSDGALNYFMAHGSNAARLAFTPSPPPAPAGGPAGPVYLWYEDDTGNTYIYNDTAWFLIASGGGSAIPSNAVSQGRLTTVSNTPVPTTDQTGVTTLFWTPQDGNLVGTYSGSSWVVQATPQTSLALGTLANNSNYDVFGYLNTGVFTLELSAAWASDTTRTDALALQDGITVKSADHKRLHLGTIRTTSTTTIEDSLAKRYVWNRYHRVPRPLQNPTETATNWNYTTATFRQANANAANQFDWVCGDAETELDAYCKATCNNTSSNVGIAVGIGINSTSANSAYLHGTNTLASVTVFAVANYRGYPGLGHNFAAWLEYSLATGTSKWFGQDISATVWQSGIMGSIRA